MIVLLIDFIGSTEFFFFFSAGIDEPQGEVFQLFFCPYQNSKRKDVEFAFAWVKKNQTFQSPKLKSWINYINHFHTTFRIL